MSSFIYLYVCMLAFSFLLPTHISMKMHVPTQHTHTHARAQGKSDKKFTMFFLKMIRNRGKTTITEIVG